MDIEEYKLRHGYKKLPFMFYAQGMFFWIFPYVLVISVLYHIIHFPIWIGYTAIVPWCCFWAYKAWSRWKKDNNLVKL